MLGQLQERVLHIYTNQNVHINIRPEMSGFFMLTEGINSAKRTLTV